MKSSITVLAAVLTLFFFTVVETGCGNLSAGHGEDEKTDLFFTVAEWNIQALFDGQDNGAEYGEYLEKSTWTPEKYAARITAISQAVPQMLGEGGSKADVPDLIGFLEIENSGVLDDLAGGILSEYGYSWTAFANIPGASLGMGFISRFPLLDIKAHSITIGEETAPRPVLEVRVEPAGKPLVFLLCHWKSKLGDENASAALRRASARVVLRRIRELKASEASTPVIVMGDLNENHDEYSRHGGKFPCALLPDTPEAAIFAGTGGDFLLLSGEKPPISAYFSKDTTALYSPWEENQGGSYYYKGKWETIDHFLLSEGAFDAFGWDFMAFNILEKAPFTNSNGQPDAYLPRSGRGLSDHIPILLFLRDFDKTER